MYPKWFSEELVKTCEICKHKFYPKEWHSKKRIYRERRDISLRGSVIINVVRRIYPTDCQKIITFMARV